MEKKLSHLKLDGEDSEDREQKKIQNLQTSIQFRKRKRERTEKIMNEQKIKSKYVKKWGEAEKQMNHE